MDDALRAKIISAYDNPNSLIGDTDFTQDERDEIRQEFLDIVDRNAKYRNWSYSADEVELIGILLFVTAKRYQGQWGGKDFWFKIAQAISPDLDVRIIQDYKLLGRICDRLKKGGKCVFTFNGGTQTAYVETILYQAYAPRSSVEYFVRLAWSIYQTELIDYAYSESDLLLCRKLIDVFARFYKNVKDEDDLDLSGQKYGIRGGLRNAFSQDPDQAALILDRIFQYIDQIYHDNEEIIGSFLGDICNTSNFQATLVRGKHARKNRGHAQPANDIDHLRPSYYLEGEGRDAVPYLCIPKTFLFDQSKVYQREEINVSMAKDGAFVPLGHLIESPVCHSMYGDSLHEINIPLTQFYKQLGDGVRLKVAIRLDGHLIYDSSEHDSLERDYLILKANHGEIRNSCRPGEFYLFCPPEMDIQSAVHIDDCVSLGSGLYYCVTKEQDYINYLGNPLFFTDKKSDSSLFFDGGDSELIRGIALFKKDNRYDFFHHPERLLIKVDPNVNLASLSLEVDNEDEEGGVFRKPLSDLPLANGLISLTLADVSADTVGCHSVYIKKAVENGTKIERELHYVVDDGCHFVIHPPLPLPGKVVRLDGRVLSKQIQAEFFRQESTCEVPLADGKIVFDIPYFEWAINNDPFEIGCRGVTRPIFIDNLDSNNSVVRIDSSLSPIEVKCGNFALDAGPGGSSFLLSRVFGYPGTQQALNRGLVVVEAIYEQIHFPLFYLTNKPYILSLNSVFTVQDNGVVIDFSSALIGRKDTVIKVEFTPEDRDDDPLVYSGEYANVPSEPLPIPDGFYSVDISYSYSSLFGSEVPVHIYRQGGVLLGNPDKARFNGVRQLVVKKATHLCRFDNVYLTKISYAGPNDFGDPVYAGLIRQPAKAVPVEFTIRNFEHRDGTIIIFKGHESDGVLVSVDKTKELISDHPIDGKTFFACSSFNVAIDE